MAEACVPLALVTVPTVSPAAFRSSAAVVPFAAAPVWSRTSTTTGAWVAGSTGQTGAGGVVVGGVVVGGVVVGGVVVGGVVVGGVVVGGVVVGGVVVGGVV